MNPTDRQRLIDADAAIRDAVQTGSLFPLAQYVAKHTTPPEPSKTPALDSVDVKPVLRDAVRDSSILLGDTHKLCAMLIFSVDSYNAIAICRELGLDPDAR